MRLLGLIQALAFLGLCHGQGKPWNEEETRIIRAKVWKFLTNPPIVLNEYRKLGRGFGPYLRQTNPNPMKVGKLRLLFFVSGTTKKPTEQIE